jgi:hypothetical protein
LAKENKKLESNEPTVWIFSFLSQKTAIKAWANSLAVAFRKAARYCCAEGATCGDTLKAIEFLYTARLTTVGWPSSLWLMKQSRT